MGWEALEQWGDDVARIEPLAGGAAAANRETAPEAGSFAARVGQLTLLDLVEHIGELLSGG
jgi:hypothetical protein